MLQQHCYSILLHIDLLYIDVCQHSHCNVCRIQGLIAGNTPPSVEPIDGAVYCNFIGCPNGYTPIPNAWEVPCSSDPCEASQCCEAFCSYHPCPNNYVPVEDASEILCPTEGCNDDLCCTSGERPHWGRRPLNFGCFGLRCAFTRSLTVGCGKAQLEGDCLPRARFFAVLSNQTLVYQQESLH